MRLLYLHHVPLNAGRANVVQVLQMCHAFQNLGVEVHLAVPKEYKSESEITRIIEEEIGEPVRFSILGYPRYTMRERMATLGCYFGIRSILRLNGKVDYCFARNPLLARLAISRGLRTIFESHEDKLHPTSGLMNKWYSKMLLEDARSPQLVQFIAISHALAAVWKDRGVPPEKLVVLHDGVAARDYQTVKSRHQARLGLGIAGEGKIVVYAGSLYEDREIDSIFQLARSFPESRFMVVGGPERRKLFYESRARRNGLANLLFVGRVPHYQVKEYLFAADVLLMLWSWQVPTINICSPLKLFEYMAAGRIIVGYAFPTIEEILVNGETALLAKPGRYRVLPVPRQCRES